MKRIYFFICMLTALLCGCDESTNGIGNTTIPQNDYIKSGTDTYKVSTRTILTDSVYARTSVAYLGKFTDPDFGEFNADFLAQLNCVDDMQFPDHIQKITGLNLYLQYNSYYGDSLNAMRMQIDTLNRVMQENDITTYYTNINPSEYLDIHAKPIVTKAYSAIGMGVIDTIDETSAQRYFTHRISLPVELGEYIYSKYLEDKNNFKDGSKFVNNVLKGLYIHTISGDGTILYIQNMQALLSFSYLRKSSSGKLDSLAYASNIFAATKEVIQANRFSNSDKLKELAQEKDYTYVKTPAGLLTEATLPIQEIYEQHQRDTLNAVTLDFMRYNETNTRPYDMNTPAHLLMIRKKDLHNYFEENKIYDNITSYIAEFTQRSNSYTFPNLSRLINFCIEEKKNGEKNDPNWLAKNPDWNKVVLIPVTVDKSSDSSGNETIVGVQNDLNMEYARLKGGTKKGNELNMQVIYTSF